MLEFCCGKYGNDDNSCVMAVLGSQNLGLCDMFSFLPPFVGKVFPYFSQESNSYKVVRQVNHLALNFLFLNGLSYQVPNSSASDVPGTQTRQGGNRHNKKTTGRRRSQIREKQGARVVIIGS